MPKIKWGAGAQALTAADVDSAESGYATYAGEIPPSGLYRFRIERIKKWESSQGNPGIKLLFVLDGSWKAGHAAFDGAPCWDQVMMLKASSGFVKAFAEAIGATSRDIVNNVVADEDDNITAIGKVRPQGMLIGLNVERNRQTQDHPWRLEVKGSGYLPAPEGSEAAEVSEDDGAGKKKKGSKKNKAKEEAPF